MKIPVTTIYKKILPAFVFLTAAVILFYRNSAAAELKNTYACTENIAAASGKVSSAAKSDLPDKNIHPVLFRITAGACKNESEFNISCRKEYIFEGTVFPVNPEPSPDYSVSERLNIFLREICVIIISARAGPLCLF